MAKTKYKGVYYDEAKGTYYVNTTFTTDDGHKIKKCKRGFATAKKANDWKLQYTVEAKDSTVINKKGSLDSILINYIEYKKGYLKPSTLRTYIDTLKTHLLPNLPNKIENINVNHFLVFYEVFSNKDIKATVKNMYRSIFIDFFKWLDLTEQMDSSLVKKFQLIFVPFNVTVGKKSSYITIEEYSKFIKTFTPKEEIYTLLFNMLFFTGARFGEVLALNYDDIDFEKSLITFNKQALYNYKVASVPKDYIVEGQYVIVPYTKTNTVKTIMIPQWLLEELKKHKINSLSKYVFWYKDGILSRQMARLIFVKHLKLAELPIIKIHDLRHSHTTMLYDNGCDSKYVAERLGHTNELTSINIYKHLTKDRQKTNDDIIKNFKL